MATKDDSFDRPDNWRVKGENSKTGEISDGRRRADNGVAGDDHHPDDSSGDKAKPKPPPIRQDLQLTPEQARRVASKG